MVDETNEGAGRSVGGYARAMKLSPEDRRRIAKAAARKRWSMDKEPPDKSLPQVALRGELVIGEVVIPCAILRMPDGSDERVLTETGITNAILGSRSGASKRLKRRSSEPLPLFLAPDRLRPFIPPDLIELQPIQYTDRNRLVVAYRAAILPAVCDVWLRARDAGVLQDQQLDKARKAEILARGLMHVGIVGLVDEATGFQDVRKKDALQKILEAYLRQELAAWAKRFPDEFYRQIFRLRGWTWKGRSVNPPQIVAHYTKDVVYARLAPGILTELEKRNPIESGKRKGKHHQLLTFEVGHPALAQHLYAVVTLMRVSRTWSQFIALLDEAHPRRGDTMLLPFMDDLPPKD